MSAGYSGIRFKNELTDFSVEIVESGWAFSHTAYCTALERYRLLASGSGVPTSLLVSAALTELAYEAYAEHPTVTRLPVVVLPGIARNDWGIAGPEGLIWSAPR